MHSSSLTAVLRWLALTLLLSLFSYGAFAGPPSIEWQPSVISKTIGNGQEATRDEVLTLVSSESLSDVQVWVTPELRPFVSLEPTQFESIVANVPYEVRVRFSIPPQALEGEYDGTVHLRVRNSTMPKTAKVRLNVDFGDFVIADTTHVLTEAATHLLTAVDEDRLVFATYSPELESLFPGQVIVAGVTDATPDGLLRTIDSLEDSGGSLLIRTSPATLGQAIAAGSLSLNEHLVPLGEASSNVSRVALSASAKQAEGFYVEINDRPLVSGVTISGSLAVDPLISLSLNKSLTDPEFGGQFLASISQTSEVTLTAQATIASVDKKFEVARYPLGAIVVWAGPVPVVFRPVLSLNFGAMGKVTAGVESSLSEEARLEGGLDFRKGTYACSGKTFAGWCFKRIGESQRPTISGDVLSPKVGFNARGYAGPQISLLVYGLAGPYSDANAYLELEANALATPWWELYGGIEFGVGIRASLLGAGVEYYDPGVYGYRRLLAQAPASAATYIGSGQVSGTYDESVWVANSSTGQQEETRCRWNVTRRWNNIVANADPNSPSVTVDFLNTSVGTFLYGNDPSMCQGGSVSQPGFAFRNVLVTSGGVSGSNSVGTVSFDWLFGSGASTLSGPIRHVIYDYLYGGGQRAIVITGWADLALRR